MHAEEQHLCKQLRETYQGLSAPIFCHYLAECAAVHLRALVGGSQRCRFLKGCTLFWDVRSYDTGDGFGSQRNVRGSFKYVNFDDLIK